MTTPLAQTLSMTNQEYLLLDGRRLINEIIQWPGLSGLEWALLGGSIPPNPTVATKGSLMASIVRSLLALTG